MRLFPSLSALLLIFWPGFLLAQSPFENGWQLDQAASNITYMSIKKGHIAETNSFATVNGQISEDGTAVLTIALDSVDTKVDLRNVRMRFLFFETFLHPQAIITTHLDAAILGDLSDLRRKEVTLPFSLSLHGVKADLSAPVIVSLLSNDRINVATVKPIPILMKDFALEPGRAKLEEAAGVTITPLAIVSLNLTFDRTAPGSAPSAAAPVVTASTAMETEGNFDRTACIGRFEILSRTGSINFAPSAARLEPSSTALLDTLYDIVSRCPDLVIEIGGHTDSQGKASWNLGLSQQRATAVSDYLQAKGIAQARMNVAGYGETKPLVPNNTAQNRAKNRRIEFSVVN
ncbi:MAG: OmpA family protein [Rhodobacteraceae bacterium]|nr:OmpA family protein [Paracoccaceae bacterium]